MVPEVLIVDDDPVVIYIHQTHLVKSGLSSTPKTASNGKEALEMILADMNKSYFVVLLDLNMPIMNGWEFLEKIQTIDKAERIFVVIVTSSVNETDKKRAFSYNQVKAYIEKPIDLPSCDYIKGLLAISDFFKHQ